MIKYIATLLLVLAALTAPAQEIEIKQESSNTYKIHIDKDVFRVYDFRVKAPGVHFGGRTVNLMLRTVDVEGNYDTTANGTVTMLVNDKPKQVTFKNGWAETEATINYSGVNHVKTVDTNAYREFRTKYVPWWAGVIVLALIAVILYFIYRKK